MSEMSCADKKRAHETANPILRSRTLPTFAVPAPPTQLHKQQQRAQSLSISASPEHLVFIDYDDTLMPSTWLIQHMDFEIDAKTKKLRTFALSARSEAERAQFVRDLDKAGQACLSLLRAVFAHFDRRNVFIVTNCQFMWVWHSLVMAGSFCRVFRDIERLLSAQKTEIIYARNLSLEQTYWKAVCFDQLLSRFTLRRGGCRLNVVTMGDQWTDHRSLRQTLCFQAMGARISHHQLKLFVEPDARYLAVELQYITALLAQNVLFRFANASNPKEQVLVEFEGYNDP